MFTGIVEAIGRIDALSDEGPNRRFWIRAPFARELREGQSVAHDGVCLTVERIDAAGGRYRVSAVPETLQRTTLGQWREGRRVNLERSLRPTSFVDGHIVQGHVDVTARCVRVEGPIEARRVTFELPQAPHYPVVMKGSVAVDGVSLTVAAWHPPRLTVALVPFTLQHTTLGRLQGGETVNIEFDVVGKYVFEWLRQMKEGLR